MTFWCVLIFAVVMAIKLEFSYRKHVTSLSYSPVPPVLRTLCDIGACGLSCTTNVIYL